ncbi:hypothetical protein [Candidatus Leptofilum sp.]|uniref:hypothetical protein n=1 Tax=Candidatus Leptofilum sp. TaxID=3241576 RepID=UPI003B5BCB15
MSAEEITKQPEQEIEINNPGWILMVIITMMLWIFGFVDLINESSEFSQAILGKYSVGYFAFLVVYALLFFVFPFFLLQKNIERLKGWVAAIQRKPVLASGIILFFIVAFVITSEYDRFTKYSVFQMCVLAMLGMVVLVLLFANWDDFGKQQRWRKIFAYPLFALTAVEIVFQLLAVANLLPSSVVHQNGLFVPYGRIYHTDQETINTTTNRYGWYYTDFREDDALNNIALIGDSYIQGLQVHPEQNLGVTLDSLLNGGEPEDGPNEVMAFAMPGFGPGTHRELTEYAAEYFAPDEYVVFINLGNDFQNVTKPQEEYFFYYVDDEDALRLESASYNAWHDSQHLSIRSHEPFYLWHRLKSNYLTASVVRGLFGASTPVFAAPEAENPYTNRQLEGVVWRKPRPWVPTHNSDWDIVFETAVSQGFTFTQDGSNDEASGIETTKRLLQIIDDFVAENEARLRIVTIPAFPPAFYEQFPDGNWVPVVDEYDLFYAEQALVTFAESEGIPILPMGSYMQAENLTSSDIRALYFDDAYSYFTPAGHNYFAEAVYDCFYSDTASESCVPNSE